MKATLPRTRARQRLHHNPDFAFYGRKDETALAPEITQATWQRFFDPIEPVFALVAEADGQLLGLIHYLNHRSTTRIDITCYLQDLFTDPSTRGRGVGRALIEGVYEQAKAAGITRVYWQTHTTNAAGRLLYDKVAKHVGFIVYSQEFEYVSTGRHHATGIAQVLSTPSLKCY